MKRKFVYGAINFILAISVLLGIVFGFIYPFFDLIEANQQVDYLKTTVRFSCLFVIIFDTPDILREKSSDRGFSISNLKLSLMPAIVMAVALAVAIVTLVAFALPTWLSLFSASTLANEWLIIPTKLFLVIFSLTGGAVLESLLLKFFPSESDNLT